MSLQMMLVKRSCIIAIKAALGVLVYLKQLFKFHIYIILQFQWRPNMKLLWVFPGLWLGRVSVVQGRVAASSTHSELDSCLKMSSLMSFPAIWDEVEKRSSISTPNLHYPGYGSRLNWFDSHLEWSCLIYLTRLYSHVYGSPMLSVPTGSLYITRDSQAMAWVSLHLSSCLVNVSLSTTLPVAALDYSLDFDRSAKGSYLGWGSNPGIDSMSIKGCSGGMWLFKFVSQVYCSFMHHATYVALSMLLHWPERW